MEPPAVPFPPVSRSEKRLQAIRDNPRGVAFGDLTACAVNCGFQPVRTNGSHHIYRHPGPPPITLDLQARSDGKAKTYQVKQFLEAVDRLYPEEDL
jgi:predicted RNA binding protein YcfA (HicA-like mRNA interferase family)